MNKLIKFIASYMAVLFLFIGISSCSGNSDEAQSIEFVSKSNSGCKNTVEKNGMQLKSNAYSESIKCKTLENGGLLIAHANASFSCEQESILTSVETKDNIIIVNEKQELSQTNCICFYDMYYTVTGLEEGRKYTVVIMTGSSEKGRLAFVYNSSLETVKEIEK